MIGPGSGEFLTIDRSACAASTPPAGITREVVLFAGTGSAVVAVTDAAFVRSEPLPVYEAETRTRIRKVAELPGASEATGGQVMFWPEGLVQPSAEDTNNSPAPSTSVTVTPVAVDGPALATEI